MTNGKGPESRIGLAGAEPAPRYVLVPAAIALSISLSACQSPGDASTSAGGTAAKRGAIAHSAAPQAAAVEFASGHRAAKFIMRAHATEGSFEPLSSGYEGYSAGTGHKANRVFTPGGSLIANGEIASWPPEIQWITNFEVAITGNNNLYSGLATEKKCARFSIEADEADVKCDWDGVGTGTEVPCGAPIGYYRVAEKNCIATGNVPIVGSGAQTDNVFIRFEVDRSKLGTYENLMVVIEYAAANKNLGPTNPSACYDSVTARFDPTVPGCADQSWQIFLKKSLSDSVFPFFTLIPPAYSFIDTTNHIGGGNVTSRQIILPIAGDPDLDVFQLSRMRGNPSAGGTTCPDHSALCHGSVFYSVTIFRI